MLLLSLKEAGETFLHQSAREIWSRKTNLTFSFAKYGASCLGARVKVALKQLIGKT